MVKTNNALQFYCATLLFADHPLLEGQYADEFQVAVLLTSIPITLLQAPPVCVPVCVRECACVSMCVRARVSVSPFVHACVCVRACVSACLRACVRA